MEGIQCMKCIYHIFGRECMVFSEIPDPIISGEVEHDTPYPGDGGTVRNFNWSPSEKLQLMLKLRGD